MRSSLESQTPSNDSSEDNARGPGKATTSAPPISIRVPSEVPNASLTRRACAIDTRCESTAQTAASNGVPKQTGRRPPASSTSLPTKARAARTARAAAARSSPAEDKLAPP